MLKTIFQGRLAFDNATSFDKLKKMYLHQTESLYKGEILFLFEDVFNEEKLVLEIPRTVLTTTDKYWQKTTQILKYSAQFAVAGRIGAWVVENGVARKQMKIEPSGDKTIVMNYKEGIQLMKEEDYENAILSFDIVLKAFSEHADALSRKAFCLKNLGRYEEAEKLYLKSIGVDEYHPQSSFGLAIMLHDLGKLEQAIKYYDLTIPRALAVQPVYWETRREKAKAFIEMGKEEKAMPEYKLLCRKDFAKTDSNYEKRGEDVLIYTKMLIEREEYKVSVELLDRILESNFKDLPKQTVAELFYLRSIAKMNANKKGYKQDLEMAEKMGFATNGI